LTALRLHTTRQGGEESIPEDILPEVCFVLAYGCSYSDIISSLFRQCCSNYSIYTIETHPSLSVDFFCCYR